METSNKRPKSQTQGFEPAGETGMIAHISDMSKSITDLSKCMVQAQGQLANALSNPVSNESVREIVREEVAAQLKSTNDDIAQVKTLLISFIERFHQ